MSALSLTVSRTIRAPRERVFQAFASIDELRNWFGPGDCHVVGGEMSFSPGGRYTIAMFTTDFGEVDLTGVFNEIVENERIRYSWKWQGSEVMESWGEMNVSVSLADHDEGTQVTIIHTGLLNEEVVDGHNVGWNGSFDKLKQCYGT